MLGRLTDDGSSSAGKRSGDDSNTSGRGADGAVVVGLGCQCWLTSTLRRLGVSCVAGPLDWVAASPLMVLHMLQTDFIDFMDPALITYKGARSGHANHALYSSMLEQYGIPNSTMFQHVPESEDLPKMLARRVERLRDLLRSDTPIIFVTGLAVPQSRSGMLDAFNEEAWALFWWLQGSRRPPRFYFLTIFVQYDATCNSHGMSGTPGTSGDARFDFLHATVQGALRGAHFDAQHSSFLDDLILQVMSSARGGLQCRPAAGDDNSSSAAKPADEESAIAPVPAASPPLPSARRVLVLVDSFYKVRSRRGHLVNQLQSESKWLLEIVKLPGGGLCHILDALKPRAGDLSQYAGILLISMGNDLVAEDWSNLPEERFEWKKVHMMETISDVSAILRAMPRHLVVYGGSGRFWWHAHPSHPLGVVFDARRDWVVSLFLAEGVRVRTGEEELLRAGYAVGDVHMFHHLSTGAQKAIQAMHVWLSASCV